MSIRQKSNRDRVHLWVPGSSEEMDRLVEESELMLTHTRAFLDRLAENEEASKEYLTHMKEDLERQLSRLRHKRDETADNPDEEPTH